MKRLFMWCLCYLLYGIGDLVYGCNQQGKIHNFHNWCICASVDINDKYVFGLWGVPGESDD